MRALVAGTILLMLNDVLGIKLPLVNQHKTATFFGDNCKIAEVKRDHCNAKDGGFAPLSDHYFTDSMTKVKNETETSQCMSSNIVTNVNVTLNNLVKCMSSSAVRPNRWIRIEFKAFTSDRNVNSFAGDDLQIIFDSKLSRVAGIIEDIGAGTYALHFILPRGGEYQVAMVHSRRCFGAFGHDESATNLMNQKQIHEKQLSMNLLKSQTSSRLFGEGFSLPSPWAVDKNFIIVDTQFDNNAQESCSRDAEGMTLASQGAFRKTSSQLLWSPFCCSMPSKLQATRGKSFKVGDSTMPGRDIEVGNPYKGRTQSTKEKWQPEKGGEGTWSPEKQHATWQAFLEKQAPSMGRDDVIVLNLGAHMIGSLSIKESSEVQAEMLCEIAAASNGAKILWATQTFIHQELFQNSSLITDERAQALHELRLRNWGRHFDLSKICDKGSGQGEWINMHMIGAAVPDFYLGADAIHVNQTLHFSAVNELLNFGVSQSLATTALKVNHVESNELDVKKLAWFHIPKTGTSFANILITWGCPRVPDDAHLEGLKRPMMDFYDAHAKECDTDFFRCGGHHPLGDNCADIDKHGGNFVSMFRQPEQRIISGFYDNKHDGSNKKARIEEYAQEVAGCGVKMLLGRKCWDEKKLNADDADQAIKILESQFAFVGLTEEWDLSVCLFHKMHGGKCHSREFTNLRPGEKHNIMHGYDAQHILGGFTDEMDGKLYARAKQLFWSNIDKFGVTKHSCNEKREAAFALT